MSQASARQPRGPKTPKSVQFTSGKQQSSSPEPEETVPSPSLPRAAPPEAPREDPGPAAPEARGPSPSPGSVFLLKKCSGRETEEVLMNFTPEEDSPFLKLNFVPPDSGILNLHLTASATFLHDQLSPARLALPRFLASGLLYSWGEGSAALGRKFFSQAQALLARGGARALPRAALAAGRAHCLAINMEGRLFAWATTPGARYCSPAILKPFP